jgi:hypothetical protein
VAGALTPFFNYWLDDEIPFFALVPSVIHPVKYEYLSVNRATYLNEFLPVK